MSRRDSCRRQRRSCAQRAGPAQVTREPEPTTTSGSPTTRSRRSCRAQQYSSLPPHRRSRPRSVLSATQRSSCYSPLWPGLTVGAPPTRCVSAGRQTSFRLAPISAPASGHSDREERRPSTRSYLKILPLPASSWERPASKLDDAPSPHKLSTTRLSSSEAARRRGVVVARGAGGRNSRSLPTLPSTLET